MLGPKILEDSTDEWKYYPILKKSYLQDLNKAKLRRKIFKTK